MKRIGKYTVGFLLAVVSVAVIGCSPNQRIVNSSTAQWSNTSANAQSTPVPRTVEQDVEAMRTADFTFIYVFRRKDGGALDDEDKRFASQVIPSEMNRRTLSDGGKVIIIGSNFRMPAENWGMLSERFAAEDLSKPVAPTAAAETQPKR